MTTIALLLAAGAGSRYSGLGHKLRADLLGRPVLQWSLDAVLAAGYDHTIVVTGDDDFADIVPEGVVRTHSVDWALGQAHSLRAGLDAARTLGGTAAVVGLADQPLVGSDTWAALRTPGTTPIVTSTYAGRRRPPVRLDMSVWDVLPSSGDAGARALIEANPELVSESASAGHPADVDTEDGLAQVRQHAADMEAVTALLGRRPMGPFEVVVRDEQGVPVVLHNFPVLADGRPMPTLYWLCGERESMLVGRLESMKGVRRAEADLGLDVINAAHDRYRIERDVMLEASGVRPQHPPTGGVGGTRQGVKCLHAHYGWWLAGGEDPVGQWVADHLHEVDHDEWPAQRTEEP